MIEVKVVKNFKQRRDFLNFPLNLYKGCEYYVPALFIDERKIFKKNYFYNEISESIFFNAYKDKKMVGRISCILHRTSNEKWNQKRVRFTRFDCIDDQEVANKLFDEATKWAKEKGMEEIVGPLGYSDMEREGLLIEGFDQLGTFEEQYNYPYYQKLIENYGFEKEVDWTEHKIYPTHEKNAKVERVSKKILSKFNLRLVKPTSTRKFVKEYQDQFFEMVDLTYSDLYGTVPFTPKMRKNLVSGFYLLIRPQDIRAVVNEKNEMMAFALVFPSISDAVRKSKGRITLPFIYRFLKAKAKPKVIDLGLVGVHPKYQYMGLSAVMLTEVFNFFEVEDIDHLETNLNLETNESIDKFLSVFNREYNKRRRCFIKKI